jgi:hypothetical protein
LEDSSEAKREGLGEATGEGASERGSGSDTSNGDRWGGACG